MSYIHIFQGAVVAGTASGSQVSENTGNSPISVTLNATNSEISSPIKLGIRCDSGYTSVNNTVITPTGDSALKWALSLDGITFEAYGDPLTITSVIDATNTIFYAKAKSTSDETPINDTLTDLVVTATIGAV